MDPKGAVEAALFSSAGNLRISDIASKTGIPEEEVRLALLDLRREYDERGSAIVIAKIGTEYRMMLRPEYSECTGTFAKADRTLRAQRVYDPASDGIVYVLLADNESDRYRTGIDATDGSRVLNYGNYGILYHLEVPVQGRSRTQFYLSPFGGTYAGANSDPQ